MCNQSWWASNCKLTLFVCGLGYDVDTCMVGLANCNSVVHGKYTRLPQRPTNFIQQVLGSASSACHQQVWSSSPPPSPAAAANDVVKIALRYRSLHQCTPSAECITMSQSQVFSAAERISFTRAWVNEQNLTSHSTHNNRSFLRRLFVFMATYYTGSDKTNFIVNFKRNLRACDCVHLWCTVQRRTVMLIS